MKKCVILILVLLTTKSFALDIKYSPDSVSTNNLRSANIDTASRSSSSEYERIYTEYKCLGKRLSSAQAYNEQLKTACDSLQLTIIDKDEEIERQRNRLSQKEKALQNSGNNELEVDEAKIKTLIAYSIKDTAKVCHKIRAIEANIATLLNQKTGLVAIKDSVSSKILTKHEQYIKSPLSNISIEHTKHILEECKPYMVDHRMNEFITRTNYILNCKQTFDLATTIISSKYNKANILEAHKRISEINGLNENQQKEINEIKNKLEQYDNGLLAFKQFILNLNQRRDGINYTRSDYKDDYQLYIVKDGLEEKIEKSVMIVPYLKQEFCKYKELIENNPMEHPAIEQEILNFQSQK